MPERLRWTPELVSRFWDFESTRPQHYFTHQHGADLVREVAPLLGGSRVLDFGCGAGFLVAHLLDAGLEVRGVDTSPRSIDATNERFADRPGFGGAHLPDDMPVPEGGFDTVFCCEVVEHVDDDSLDGVLGMLARLVRPGGTLVVTTPNDEDLDASEVYCPVSDVVFHRWQHVRSWTAPALVARIVPFGFEPVDVRALHFGRTWRTSRGAAAVDLARRAAGRGTKPPHLLAVLRRA